MNNCKFHNDPICSYDVRIEEAAKQNYISTEVPPPMWLHIRIFQSGAKFIIDEYLNGSEIDRKYFEHELVPQLESKHKKLLEDHEYLKKGCDHFEKRTYELSFKYNSLLEASERLVDALNIVKHNGCCMVCSSDCPACNAHIAIEQYRKDAGND